MDANAPLPEYKPTFYVQLHYTQTHYHSTSMRNTQQSAKHSHATVAKLLQLQYWMHLT